MFVSTVPITRGEADIVRTLIPVLAVQLEIFLPQFSDSGGEVFTTR